MAGSTRSSSRLSSGTSPQKSKTQDATDPAQTAAGQKRKAENTSSPRSKKGKTGDQQTLEETLPNQSDDKSPDQKPVQNSDINDKDMNEALDEAEAQQDQKQAKQEQMGQKDEPKTQAKTNGSNATASTNGTNSKGSGPADVKSKDEDGTDAKTASAESKDEDKAAANNEQGSNGSASEANTTMDNSGKLTKESETKPDLPKDSDGAVEVTEKREEAIPSNILEKGIIYFLTRGRVGVESPDSVQDLARSYMVLRPLPDGAKLNQGPIEDMKNARLLALPKKVLPKSGRDRFMTFVEKASVSINELKEDFLKGSDYDTKTVGTRQTPPVTPIGEGVYAITTQGRDSHLAYMLTIPEEIGDVQSDMGIADKGSFVLSVKNPEASGPAGTNLPQGPDWPKEVQEEFRGLRWMPLQPKHLEYPNCQFLLIGERAGELGKAGEPTEKDAKDDSKETPAEELETLEGEDEARAEALGHDDAVFADLQISHGDYPKLQTTW